MFKMFNVKGTGSLLFLQMLWIFNGFKMYFMNGDVTLYLMECEKLIAGSKNSFCELELPL